MTDTLSREDIDLELLLMESIPCGGNSFPENRPCPRDAEAEYAYCACRCPISGKGFKCDACFQEWYSANRTYATAIRCNKCGKEWPIEDAHLMYRRI